MKVFKRFLKIFGICFAGLIGFVGIVVSIFAITGGFNPKPIEITRMSFLSSDGKTPADEISKISIIDDYVARIYYEPENATEKNIELTVVGDGVNIIEISSQNVNAGIDFVIKPKKRTVIVDGKEVQVNVGGEAQIVAKDQNNYKSCKLFVTVDVEVPIGGLSIIGVEGGEYREYEEGGQTLRGYRLNRVGNGLFQFAVQTFPTNALEPNTKQYIDAKNIGSKKAFLTLPSGNAFEVVGDPVIKTSYYSASSKMYFDYDGYKTVVSNNQNGTYSLIEGEKTYSDLIITQHYVYTLKISEDVANGKYDILAKVFKTYDIQEDFLAMRAGFANHDTPVGEEEYKAFCNFVAKYKKYIIAEEEGAIFIQSHSNNVGDIQINNPTDYNEAVKFLQVETSTTFILEDIDIISMNTTETSISFDLHSKTYTDANGTVYNLDNLSKENLIKLFGLYLNVQGTSDPVTKWVGDIEVISLKGITAGIDWNSVISVVNGQLVVAPEYDHSDTIKVSFSNGKYSLTVLDELEINPHAVLMFATKYGDGESFTEQYKLCTISIESIIVNLPEDIKINTNASAGGIDTSMNTNLTDVKKEQTFGDGTIQVGKGRGDADAPLTYEQIMLFVTGDNLFVGEGYPKIKLGSGELTYVIGANSTIYTAYELPKDSDGNYYIRALNNTGDNKISIFAAVVKTDINGNVCYKKGTEDVYVLAVKSGEVQIKIDTYAEADDLRWYVENNGQWYEKGISAEASRDNELKMLLNESYDIFVTLYNLNQDGEVVIPDVEDGVDYLYNMGYAMKDLYSNANTSSSFGSNGYLTIDPPAYQENVDVTIAGDVGSSNATIQLCKIKATTTKSVYSTTEASQRRLYLNGYRSRSLEFIISKITISDIVISLKNDDETLVEFLNVHPTRPYEISREFENGSFVWKINGKALTNITKFAYSYTTDIDYIDEQHFSDKIDIAFRTEENIDKYKEHFGSLLGTEMLFGWASSDNDIAEVTTTGFLTMKQGSFVGDLFNVAITMNTYKNNTGEGGSDTATMVVYFVSREYPINITGNTSEFGEVKNNETAVEGETSRIISNDSGHMQTITSATTLENIFKTNRSYFTDNNGNIIKQINIFDDILRASEYSLEIGDSLTVVGNAKFINSKSITITEGILNSKTLNIILDDITNTDLSFNLTKKNVNIFDVSMKEGYLVEITSGNSVFADGATTIVVTSEMIEAKKLNAILNTGALNTNISVKVYEPNRRLTNIVALSDIGALFEDGYTGVRLSVSGGLFTYYNKEGVEQSAYSIDLTSALDLEKYYLSFNFSGGYYTASISYTCWGEGKDNGSGTISNCSNYVTEKSFDAKRQTIFTKTYSYKVDKLIDVDYNGISLLYNEDGSLKTFEVSEDHKVLTINGVEFVLSNNFTWTEDGKINYSGENATEVLQITIKIGGIDKIYYVTYGSVTA